LICLKSPDVITPLAFPIVGVVMIVTAFIAPFAKLGLKAILE
jgi:hypothetical protein